MASEVAEHSAFSVEQCSDNMADWLEELRLEGLVWAGALANSAGQQIMAAVLTTRGKELVA